MPPVSAAEVAVGLGGLVGGTWEGVDVGLMGDGV